MGCYTQQSQQGGAGLAARSSARAGDHMSGRTNMTW